METLFHRNTAIAAFAAVVVVGLTGLTLERGHAGAEPRGIIEIGQPETLSIGNLVVADLPAVDVYATREVQLADVKTHAEPQG